MDKESLFITLIFIFLFTFIGSICYFDAKDSQYRMEKIEGAIALGADPLVAKCVYAK